MKTNDTITEYFLNGKKVGRETIVKRENAMLDSIENVVRKYYKAPLNNVEKIAVKVAAENSSKFWKEHREMRQQSEQYHGG